MKICVCEFPDMCDGSGRVHCMGCGGDQCTCGGCMGEGVADCDGCEWCRRESDDDQEDDGTGELAPATDEDWARWARGNGG